MGRFGRLSGLALAGLMLVGAGAVTARAEDGGDTYRNIIDRDAFVQDLVDQRTDGSRYQNVITRDAFEDQLVDGRVSDAQYRNVQTPENYDAALRDNYEPPYRNVFSTDRFMMVIGDPCQADGETSGPVLLTRCEVR